MNLITQMKRLTVLGAVLTLPLASLAATAIYQAGTMLNLMQGIYTGSTTFADLATQGNLGLGTDNGLGGELVEIDRKFYLADEAGNAHLLPMTEKTPFTMTTEFTPTQVITLQNIQSLTDLQQKIDHYLPSNNMFYAIRVDGDFAEIKARSVVPPATPYPPLAEVIKTNQRVFYFHDMDGSLVIFKSPNFMSPVTVPGYHVHFISADRQHVGHVFDIKMATAKVSIEPVSNFNLLLPQTVEYTQANLNPLQSGSGSIKSIESHS